eukprot:7491744-Lingulodinium_polyedra.AAC.1
MCDARAHHARARFRCEYGARVRGALRRVETANQTFERIITRRFSNAAQRCGQTRGPPRQRGVMRHARARQARTNFGASM